MCSDYIEGVSTQIDLYHFIFSFFGDHRNLHLLAHSIPTRRSSYLEGCDRPCSFCAIPLMRGKHVSKPTEQLVTEARKLAARGTRELVLIAQDSTYYGLDISGRRRLPDRLRRLSDVAGIEWLRLTYD